MKAFRATKLCTLNRTVGEQNTETRREEKHYAGTGPENVRFGPQLASIVRCDFGQTFEMNLDTGEYVAVPYPPQPLSKAQAETSLS
jgi:hypothetical protein